jgi:hypothetical protein
MAAVGRGTNVDPAEASAKGLAASASPVRAAGRRMRMEPLIWNLLLGRRAPMLVSSECATVESELCYASDALAVRSAALTAGAAQ